MFLITSIFLERISSNCRPSWFLLNPWKQYFRVEFDLLTIKSHLVCILKTNRTSLKFPKNRLVHPHEPMIAIFMVKFVILIPKSPLVVFLRHMHQVEIFTKSTCWPQDRIVAIFIVDNHNLDTWNPLVVFKYHLKKL